ncbi:MAG: outer membrane beta-barrel protein [Sulfuricella sp.]
MKLARTSGTLGLVALAVIVSPFAAADDTGWYVGANAGRSKATIDDVRITNSLVGQGATATSISDDNRATGYKLFGGYQFNKNFALEGGYFDLGKFGFVANTQPPGTLNGNIKLRGLNLDAVGILPITDRFSAFGRVGLNYAQARDSFSGTGIVNVTNPNPSKREANYKFGAGLQYALTDSLGMRAEAERYRINDAVGNKGDVDLVSVGLVYRFGEKTPAPAPIAAAPAPEPVVVAPPPPPPVAVGPEKAAFVPITLQAETLFDFDKSVLRADGKKKLDEEVVDKMKEYPQVEVILVTGYADRIGTVAYNQKLSQRRADAVKAYLVGQSVEGNRIETAAKGESDPVVSCDNVKGKVNGKNRKLVECLQPNRRVMVEVKVQKPVR